MLPAAFEHEYQLPPDTSWALTVLAVAGLIVNETESTFVGFAAFGAYVTLVIAYPAIVFAPCPISAFGTVLDAVNAEPEATAVVETTTAVSANRLALLRRNDVERGCR